MSAESLHPVDEPAPNSSIREAASAEPRISVEIRTTDSPLRARSLAPADDAIGRVLAGKYRVERKLGEGAMGVVLAATHVGLDELVAIKFMRPEVHGMAGTLERFTKEAKIAARIRSEHVAKVLDVGEAEPIGPFIVMEYLEGKSLADLLDARSFEGRGPMPVDRVVEYMLQACEALAAAHAIGVIHRDVKPDNLFVTRHNGLEVLKLLDFGISKAALTPAVSTGDVGSATAAVVMGTPLYMSPEQLRSLPDIDCRTDIWSMGAVMYELLSGEPPFQAASIPEICASILDSAPAALPASCPAALRAVVMRCLERDRALRFQSVAELAAALVPLAPGDARAYASRSSGILRASALRIDLSSDPGKSLAPKLSEPRPRRFQSSALVAAATVLSLSALGVTISVAKMRSPGVEAAAAAVAPLPAGDLAIPTERDRLAPAESVTSAESVTAAEAMTAPAPEHGSVAPDSSPAAPAPAASPPGPDVAPLLTSRGPAAVTPVRPRASSSTARATRAGNTASGVVASEITNGSDVPAAPSPLLGTSRRATGGNFARTGRVRLVEQRSKLRLVDDVDAPPRGARAGVSAIRRVGGDDERSAP